MFISSLLSSTLLVQCFTAKISQEIFLKFPLYNKRKKFFPVALKF